MRDSTAPGSTVPEPTGLLSHLPARLRGPLGWLLAPATEEVPKAHAIGAAGLRILVGMLWLYNVAWKRMPDFGQDAGNGLYKFTSYAVSHPVLPPYSWVVENIVLKVFTPFGILVLIAETTLAVLLLTGTWVRLAAALGLAQSVAIALSVAFAPDEWPWAYWMMIGIHALLLVSSAGRYVAVDAVRAGLAPAAVLARLWGALAVLLGVISTIGSISDPLAKVGYGFRSTDLSMSTGQFNLVGGLVLVVVGALMIAGSSTGRPRLGQAAAALAALGALSLHAQIGFTDPLLGGTPTSAAVLFCLALVAAMTSRAATPSGARRREPAS